MYNLNIKNIIIHAISKIPFVLLLPHPLPAPSSNMKKIPIC
jgi:hypothetical protein